MPINADTAATVAARHGLGLSDAAAMMSLADDEAHADKLAEQFANATEAAERATVRQLFKGGNNRLALDARTAFPDKENTR